MNRLLRNLEDLDLLLQFRVQRKVWQDTPIEAIVENEIIYTHDVEAIMEIQAAQRRFVPEGKRVAGCFPWTIGEKLLTNTRVRKDAERIMGRLKRPNKLIRPMMSLPPFIDESGMRWSDALLILKLLPDTSAGAGWEITILRGSKKFLESPRPRGEVLKEILGNNVSFDVVVADDAEVSDQGTLVQMTRPDVPGSPDYAASLMATAIISITHHRAMGLVHARGYRGTTREPREIAS